MSDFTDAMGLLDIAVAGLYDADAGSALSDIVIKSVTRTQQDDGSTVLTYPTTFATVTDAVITDKGMQDILQGDKMKYVHMYELNIDYTTGVKSEMQVVAGDLTLNITAVESDHSRDYRMYLKCQEVESL